MAVLFMGERLKRSGDCPIGELCLTSDRAAQLADDGCGILVTESSSSQTTRQVAGLVQNVAPDRAIVVANSYDIGAAIAASLERRRVAAIYIGKGLTRKVVFGDASAVIAVPEKLRHLQQAIVSQKWTPSIVMVCDPLLQMSRTESLAGPCDSRASHVQRLRGGLLANGVQTLAIVFADVNADSVYHDSMRQQLGIESFVLVRGGSMRIEAFARERSPHSQSSQMEGPTVESTGPEPTVRASSTKAPMRVIKPTVAKLLQVTLDGSSHWLSRVLAALPQDGRVVVYVDGPDAHASEDYLRDYAKRYALPEWDIAEGLWGISEWWKTDHGQTRAASAIERALSELGVAPAIVVGVTKCVAESGSRPIVQTLAGVGWPGVLVVPLPAGVNRSRAEWASRASTSPSRRQVYFASISASSAERALGRATAGAEVRRQAGL
ncbi:MAG: hypothetical protein IT431_17940 [Phycisphaerales bacterium]|nr:hypothetical protein [Phycisphaerales bacterium]